MSAALELLRPLPLFTALTPDELGKIAELCETKSYDSGEYIFREGEPGNRLFIIVVEACASAERFRAPARRRSRY